MTWLKKRWFDLALLVAQVAANFVWVYDAVREYELGHALWMSIYLGLLAIGLYNVFYCVKTLRPKPDQ